MNEQKPQNKLLRVVPQIAKKIGEKSINQVCLWWFNQPKVPESMKTMQKEKEL